MSYELIAITMFAGMMVLLLTGQRVFAVIGFVGVVAAFALWGDGGSQMGFAAVMKLVKWYPMLSVPMFVFMGYMLSESGIAEDMYKAIHVWMGSINGGLALGTVGLMVVISAMNGLSVAGLAIGATIALPELLRRGYDKQMITGVVQGGSTLGILLPPSVVLILYGMIARVPVGQLWLAGVLPGLLMALLMGIYVWLRCRINPKLGPALPAEERNVPLAQKIRLLGAGIAPLGIFALMMWLFLSGRASLVESSAVGAISSSLIAWFRGRLSFKLWNEVLQKTLGITCMFMWILIAALCFGAVFDGLGAVKSIERFFLSDLGLAPWQVLVLMQVSFLIMGMFLDDTAMLVIVAPLYIPLVQKLGFDLVWYGVLYTITCQIAYITPPFGYNLFMMRALAPPGIGLPDIYRSIWPFVGIMLLCLLIVGLLPEIATWLPQTLYRK